MVRGQPAVDLAADAGESFGRYSVVDEGALFPHLYGGPLRTAAIAWEAPLRVGPDGSCTLPEAVR